jgi:uncharacterized protein DUF6748
VSASRAALAIGLVALAFVPAATLAATNAPGSVYRLRPDLRLCPSPACGGFYVSRVNRGTTTCADGIARTWCYMAELDLGRLSPKAQSRVRSAVNGGGVLVRGTLGRGTTTQLGSLGRLAASAAWLPATRATWAGIVWRVSYNGIACIRAPCFTLTTSIVNASRVATASGLVLSGVGAPDALVRQAGAAVNAGGLLVAGTIRREPDGGRTIVAAEFFLPAG